MMYISKVKLSEWSANCYRHHQLLWKMFPGVDECPFHFGISPDGSILVISRVMPQSCGDAEVLEVKPYNPQISNGQLLEFSVRLNNVRRDHGKTSGFVNGEDLIPWMIQKFQGADVNDVAIVNRGIMPWKKHARSSNVSYVDFEGTLVVTDHIEFTKLLFNGVGRRKCTGCGFLMVRRIGTGVLR